MNTKTIVIPVGPTNPEDDILELVDILKRRFPDQTLKTSDALVIETNIEEVAALLSKLPEANIPANKNGSGKAKTTYQCVVCGGPVSKPNRRCRSCAQNKRQPGDVVAVELKTE